MVPTSNLKLHSKFQTYSQMHNERKVWKTKLDDGRRIYIRKSYDVQI